MPDPAEQLVRSITEQVIAAIARTQSSPGASASANAPANIHPPIGICTGDYSKFPELRNSTFTPPPTTGRSDSNTGVIVLTGIITASQIDSQPGPIITLASTARLTPLANDRIKERKLTLQRTAANNSADSSAAATSTTHQAQGVPQRYLYWVEGHCPAVRQVTTDLRASLRPAPASSAKSLPTTLRSISQQIRGNRAAGAILFVRSAAAAVCYANRCPSLRASVATCGEAVEQAIDFIAANTLIIEYPHHGPAAIRAMTERFITASRPKLPNLQRDLTELTRCV